ncbi:MAG: hypothetical protein CME61_02235 [Halobacteriovoraceae bacterium]|nr:hypothetical protein [Halobacteriovoraceae bacterium]
MILDSLNINSLRVFERVYQLKSMTLSAKELGLTQSGVSQHIKNLEKTLGVTLFDRVKHKIIPTKNSDQLATLLTRYFRNIERELNQISVNKLALRGEVTIGIPLEFGNNFVLPLLAIFGQENSQIHFNIKYGITSEMNELMLNGEIDFAFIDQFEVDTSIETIPVWNETICLCAKSEYLQKNFGTLSPKHELRTYDNLQYVDYVKGAPVLKLWFEHHLKSNFSPNIRASLMDVQGMTKIISTGLGAGILPLHVINRINETSNTLTIFKGSNNPLLNKISLAYLSLRTLSTAAVATKDYLIKNLPEAIKNRP